MAWIMTIQGEPAAPLYAYLSARGHRDGLLGLPVHGDAVAVLAGPRLSGLGPAAGPGRDPAVLRLVAARTDPRRGRSTPGQRGQEPLPGQHEPRVPYTAERPGRHDRSAGHHPPGR
ncbi:hypothetical protein G6F40_015778 [Rhizopus arrhizus]|nr:hypothetical protein G6F40_015778 [Rhizopus arrhizus]